MSQQVENNVPATAINSECSKCSLDRQSKTKGGILLPFCVGVLFIYLFTCVFKNSDYSTIFYTAFSSPVLESSWPPGPMFFFFFYNLQPR